jgi:hypothetical protein
MLLPYHLHPENSIYYNGSIVLEILQQQKSIGIIELYELVRQNKKMSFQIFILSLDWLYLLNVAEINNREEIILCS